MAVLLWDLFELIVWAVMAIWLAIVALSNGG